ncbi:hypothetical protein HMPREF1982_04071 [Clostridiales bacterium oral taxon 876 str. F0540]|nr:hypothetical protein HMPREF1982_04071 [Clostridiales bacterium oral taxon 876 str. F0540]
MKLDILNKSKKEIFINMQNEIFTGNVLDIGTDNYGIIYSLYKQYNDEGSVEYVHGKEEKNFIAKDEYDNCIMLFSLRNIWLKNKKKYFLKDISSFLRENGVLHIWDIDKGYSKIFRANIKVMVSERKLKDIKISDFNALKDNSKESTIKLLKDYFEIIDLKASDNIYYIKAKKKSPKPSEAVIEEPMMKGSNSNEGSSSSGKFKVHSY